MKKNKTRYFNSFFITICIYTVLVIALVYSSKNIIKNIDSKDHKVISLNHVILKNEEQKVTQVARKQTVKEAKKEKKKVVPKKIKKEESKKVVKKKIEKKIPKKKKHVEKEVVKKKIEKEVVKNEAKQEPKKKMHAEPEPIKQVKKQALVKKPIKTAKKKKVQEIDYEKEYLSVNLKKILIEIRKNIRYPKIARRRGIEGVVNVEFKLYPNGSIGTIHLISGHKLLKKSAFKAIKKASKDFPKVLKPILLRLPIGYTLS